MGVFDSRSLKKSISWPAGALGMPRYKFIERDFPHIVEIVVPYRGLRGKWDAINDFHARHGINPHQGAGDIKMVAGIWCFADREIAEAFAAKFHAEKSNVRLQR
jgi:hypothetical protein